MGRHRAKIHRTILLAGFFATVAALAACRSDDTDGPRWRGSFTRAISTCGASLTPFVLDPPREALVESRGVFEPGSRVSLLLADGCALPGTIEPDGRLVATLDPGCPTAGTERVTLVVEDVFAPVTVIHRTTDHADPQQCDVEVWGTFTRE